MDLRQRPTVRQLEYVVAVADHLSFSNAAEACGVSQPALSSQIREVEQRLGLSLFERGRGGVSVPPHARPVIDAARRAIRTVDDVVDAAIDLRGELVGPVRVGVIPTMAPYLLPTLVRELRRRQPRAEPVLTEERTDELVRRIALGELDIGLLASPVPGEGLEVVEVAVDQFDLAMPEDHPFAGEGSLPSGMLSGLPVMLLEDGHCLRDQAIDVCATVGANPEHADPGDQPDDAVPDGVRRQRCDPPAGQRPRGRGQGRLRAGHPTAARPPPEPDRGARVAGHLPAGAPVPLVRRGHRARRPAAVPPGPARRGAARRR